MGILARLRLAKIRIMARPNSPDMAPKRTKKVRLGIIITSAEVIIAGGRIFLMAASRFVDVPEEEIKLMKEGAIQRDTKHATKFGVTLFKGKM